MKLKTLHEGLFIKEAGEPGNSSGRKFFKNKIVIQLTPFLFEDS